MRALKGVRVTRLTIAVIVTLVAAATAAWGTASGSAKKAAGGTVTVASAQGIPQLDPYKILFSFEQILYPLLWNSLTQFTPTGGSTVKPDLATSWSVSKDARTYTFHLRPGVQFSNGTPLIASDVVLDVKRALGPSTKFIWSFLFPKVASATAVNKSTVRVKLATPSTTFPSLLAELPIVDPSAVGQINSHPIGTGPYLLQSFVPNDHVTLVPNPKYWGPKPSLSTLTIERAQDNTSAVTALQSGSLDALWSVPWSDVPKFANSSSFHVVSASAPSASIIIETDNTSPPFNNVKARQALAYAVDRQTIVNTIYGGKVVAAMTNQPIPPSDPTFDPSLPKFNFDLAKAKQLFAQAGVKSGSTLTYWTTAGEYDEWTTMGEILQSDLQKIGINLQIKTNEPNTWAARFAPAGKKWPGLLVPNFYSGFTADVVAGFWRPGICECNFDNAGYNAALQKAQAALTLAQQKVYYAKAERIFSQQAPAVVMAYGSWPVAVSSRVSGVWEDPGTQIHFEDASVK